MIQPGDAVLYIVRHGNTAANGAGVFRGFSNPSLDDKGRREARQIAEFFSRIPVAKIYSSDLDRATETADIVAKRHGLVPEQLVSFRPLHVGQFTGESKKANKDKIRYYVEHPDVPIPDGESLDEFSRRVFSVYDDKLDEALQEGAPIVLVGHSSDVHAASDYVTGDHLAVGVEPGGIAAIYLTRQGLELRALTRPKIKETEGTVS